MEADTAMVLGIIIGVFSLISIFSALVDRRPPRASAITVLIATGLVVYAASTSPVGYTVASLPKTFVNVVVNLLP
ncbi:hypothetical protein [Roseobacter sp. A03A-229]